MKKTLEKCEYDILSNLLWYFMVIAEIEDLRGHECQNNLETELKTSVSGIFFPIFQILDLQSCY